MFWTFLTGKSGEIWHSRPQGSNLPSRKSSKTNLWMSLFLTTPIWCVGLSDSDIVLVIMGNRKKFKWIFYGA